VSNPTGVIARNIRIPWSIALLAILFVGAGALHFIIPRPYEGLVPTWLPNSPIVVRLSGVVELLGGVGILIPVTRPAAGRGLILLLIAVFPANVEMLRLAHAASASGLWQVGLWLRLPLQVALIWWVWRAAAGGSAVRRAA
jgi:uncharacterized membrane protein